MAVLTRDLLSAEQRFHIAQDLAFQLHRDVDLLDLRTTSIVMRMQVLSTGQCLETRDDQAKKLRLLFKRMGSLLYRQHTPLIPGMASL